MLVRTEQSTGGCTANFIYDGLGPVAGRTFIGMASHCFAENEPPGTTVLDRDRVPFGRLVVKTRPLRSVREDWALIEISPHRLADVDASVRGNPKAPTGVADVDDVAIGDEVRVSGWGSFMYLYPELQQNRAGRVTNWDSDVYEIVAPVLFGDSGGGLIHVSSGKALGLVSAWCTPTNYSTDHLPLACTVYGPTIRFVEEAAAERGYPIRMRRAGESGPPPPARGG